MDATGKRNLSLILSGRMGKKVQIDCLIEEQDDILITDLAAMTGKDPSYLMNEAIGELIRRYRPRARDSKRKLRLV
ncbi:MAG TPA: hypothetical protein PLT09_08495 [Deltaproteobacteria bacterium]|nr:hypothetical protein [Deltaproteobacteria bacterium]HXK47469.1 hypothetical protein [Deltaproteobacteria bacterium]